MSDFSPFPSRRPPLAERGFRSDAIENVLSQVAAKLHDREVAWLFQNCLPNTLDTTVQTDFSGGKPDSFVITGDIPAMWLRDSTAQVWPYLPFMKEDNTLKTLVEGLVNRQAACVRLAPYANAFYKDNFQESKWKSDQTTMLPGVHERKYELDSLGAVLRLAVGFWKFAGEAAPFDDSWLEALGLILETIRDQQAGGDEKPKYTFRRTSDRPTETLAGKGAGQPARRCGLSKSPFRPSDDAALLPFLVPANALAVVGLRDVAQMLDELALAPQKAQECRSLADEIAAAIGSHAVISHPRYGPIYAYEVDGFGSHYLMDDANVPSLLSLPYLGFCALDDPIYQNTRAFVLSEDNPYFDRGSCGEGIGGPHVGKGWIWPMSITLRALTSQNEAEIAACVGILKRSHAGTGFMHETFWKDDATRFSRHWFAWANTLFGELILKLERERPQFLHETVF